MSDATFPETESPTPSAENEFPAPEAQPSVAPDSEETVNAEVAPVAEPVQDANTEVPVDPKIDSGIVSEIEAETDHQATLTAETAAPVPIVPVVESEPEAEPEPEESFADIFSEFQRTHSRREAGSQIRGTVVSLTSDAVLVDIGFKSEGTLPLTAFAANRELPKPGDALQVSVKGRDEDGYYALSLFRTAVPKDWTSLERAFQEKSTIVGTVTGLVKGGMHVDVGVRAFMPASRSGARDAAEMEKLVGEEVRVRITRLSIEEEDVVVDRRIVTEEEAEQAQGRRYAEIREGAVVDGIVRSITEYGAFVDLGGLDGLLHISDMAWSRVASVSDLLSVGEKIEVKVLKIDPETRRIALGLKQLQAHPWDAVQEKYALGERVRGVVTRLADFGAFVELEPGVEGLVHLSEMSWTKRILKATEVVKVGDVVDAVILSIGIPERRMSLGLKQALGDPWVAAAARLAPGSVVEGPVSSILKFGAFVQVSEGVEGLVHISEIAADRRLNHPSDVLRVGQVVRALVLEVDKDKRQLRLSMKQLIPTSLDEFLAEHKIGDQVTGRLASLENGTAQVELGEGVFCACVLPAQAPAEPASVLASVPASVPAGGKVDLSAFSSMLASKWKTGGTAAAGAGNAVARSAEPPVAGQVRTFRITELDATAKRIGLELIP